MSKLQSKRTWLASTSQVGGHRSWYHACVAVAMLSAWGDGMLAHGCSLLVCQWVIECEKLVNDTYMRTQNCRHAGLALQHAHTGCGMQPEISCLLLAQRLCHSA